MEYLSAQNISDIWGISKRRVQYLCINNRIPGAMHIGNMWVIPSNASKPKDRRFRKHTEVVMPLATLIRKARRTLKTIVDSSFDELLKKGLCPKDVLSTLVVIFSSSILNEYIDDSDICLRLCESFFNYRITVNVSNKVLHCIEQYITDNAVCLDDSLSWVYQFGTKKSEEFRYRNTQFFTEKYMINTLVDSLSINANSKIADPACGGGNFLLYSFDKLVSTTDNMDYDDRINHALENLCGYEIDQFLAHIAAFNLKLKAVSLMSEVKSITAETFNSFHPNIFYPLSESVSGFLDANWEKQIVVNCDSKGKKFLSEIFNNFDIMVTNPPFQTIKGMSIEQRKYLQEHYPESKCDMCNAFIVRILNVIPNNGKAAMVTQNSWMYLDSFTELRDRLLTDYTINEIWELGSNAFYDLSGEKANVSLVTFTKTESEKMHTMSLHLLRNMSIEELEETIEKDSFPCPVLVKQSDVRKNTESRFDMVSTDHLKLLQTSSNKYKDYAVPMQGTSTGDAKNLIDYYWRHIGDKDWILVSKGGGYSRFEGLNSYCVKWGTDGEYIKNTKGSAIRNANYFHKTQLVFSDTGTAGLNVRVLMPEQIFVASGPGIRIKKGRTLSHLAFLNSRFAAFYVRLISPKLTIAAGYIGQIPVTEKLLNSEALEKYAKQCLLSKEHRLSKRPNNVEFTYIHHQEGKSISEVACEWYVEDLNDEWTQLVGEQEAEDFINKEMHLDSADLHAIDDYIGKRVVFKSRSENTSAIITNIDTYAILGYDCLPKRTKASKKSLGVDGLIEYIAQIKDTSCEEIYLLLKNHYDWFEKPYIDLYMHALVMSAMEYRELAIKQFEVDKVVIKMGVSELSDIEFSRNWIETSFNDVHNAVFEGKPLYEYNPVKKMIARVKE